MTSRTLLPGTGSGTTARAKGQAGAGNLDRLVERVVERLRAGRSTPAREPIRPAPPGGAGRATALLTYEQAEALELAYLGGTTHAESARALGVDQATFRIRVGTASSRLRQDLDTGRQATPPWPDTMTRKQT